MDLTDEQLDASLHFDPLAAAEVLSGTSYKEDEPTMWLGFALMQDKRKVVDAALLARDDTMFRNELPRYERIITDYGFHKVLELPFKGRGYADTPAPDETMFVYLHDAYGLLLVFDTYQTTNVNGGKVYYCWRPSPDLENRGHLTSSGHMWWSSDDKETADKVWCGDHDCREALIFNLENLRKNGEFVTPWVEDSRVWLGHHGDDYGSHTDREWSNRIDAVRSERMAMLPDDVLAVIRPQNAKAAA